ncbi:ATP-dependent DNA helicase [Agriterribacter sp.]|uniref:ATP-dependent helicase n=1 Tax=Agriterribacter sp. TaxID=2821509 RepID=UPI002BF4006F|nr:ATP-dependent DNA helicase [Agriterribacter sp.]HRP56811.1 ATP-dependent DNA helicase [Agriterribacter sp.]
MSFVKEKLHIKFREEYNKLNEQQRKAVDTIEGAVLVDAGPGTGKTQVLALRIANILRQTDINPNNILCLTYTDNGAVEMRNRLLRIIGSAAYGIRIHTFHSFCNEVIQDNLTYFGKLNLSPIGDLEEIDLFYRLIDSIPADNKLKRFRGDIYYEKDRLRSLFSLMKKEAWTPEYLNERIDAYIKELPVKEGFFYKKKYKEFNANDPRPAAIADETEKMEILRAAANLYPQYNEMMTAAGRYNFDDMILWVLNAFKKNNDLLLDYQERFLYFLVDEFQDTSRSQNLLLQKLTGYWEVPNLFVVGDPDQGIFSFQDANVENIRAFEERHKNHLTTIELVNNYRSAAPILNAANKLILYNTGRLKKDDSPLLSSNPAIKDIAAEPILVEYANTGQEGIDVTIQIEKLLQHGVKGKEIAVIYRNHAQVETIASMLEGKQIPVNAKKKVDILELPFIQNLLLILQWVEREKYIPYSADDILFLLLHSSFFTLHPLEIAKLTIAVNAKNKATKEDVFSLRRMMAETALPKADLFNQPNGQSVREISDTLEALLKASQNSTVQQLLEMVIQKAGVLSCVMQSPEKPWLMQVLNALFDHLKEESHRNPGISLKEWLDNIEKMKANRLPIPLYKITANDEGVNMVTAHGAKGSEYAHVFVIGCTQKIWDDNNRQGNRLYKMPDNLVSNSVAPPGIEESRRLFYVALTRAKTHLHISYAVKDEKDKEQTRSTFITELLEAGSLQLISKAVPDIVMAGYLQQRFKEKAKPEIELVEAAYIDEIMKRYTMSVTHLNNYLNCPLKFYYQNLIRVPAAKNENMAFGSAIHWAIERLFIKMKENGNVFLPKEDLLADFYWYMKNNREAFTPEAFKLKTAYGEKILPAYYDHYIDKWNKIIVVEKPVRNVTVQHVPVNGKLDKLEFNGRLVNVVDYKTGKYENARKKLVRPNEKEPNGGDYWRQAVFYKILMDNDKTHDWKVISTEFDFIEPVGEVYKTELVEVTEADITTVTQQIVATWQKIQNREFKTGCGKPDCDWCNFVKTNDLAVALHTLEAEDGGEE